jgi:hypothetical protein
MRLFALIAAFALAACQPGGEDVSPAAPAPVVLTVFSPGVATEAPRTGLFERYAMTGPAQGFTLVDLAGLESFEVDVAYPAASAVKTWRGPRLSAVLAVSGEPGAGAALTALDGYSVELSAALIAEHEPILAISVDGAGLTVGGLGPVTLIWPETYPGPDSEHGSANWVWSVFAVEVIER